jgi:signal transduction histidine kinase/ActR/RegA family two-component response regulator/HAMP domain-containing protein
VRPSAAKGSVRGRLMRVVLLTTCIAVWVAGAALLTLDLSVYRKSWASDLSNEAAILARSTAPALEFDDHAVAERNLAALQARPQVLVAAIYAANGKIYASYVRPGTSAPPPAAPVPGLRMTGERIELAQPIQRKGETLGVIYLEARYDILGRMRAFLGIFVLVTLLSLAVAFLFSSRLQAGITEPLDAMAGVAREIVSRRDYSLRARKVSDDEIGVVVDAFNNMLEEVQSRSQALEQSNHALHEEIAVRESTQAALSVATARLESTMAAAEIGSWVWDVRRNKFTADRNLAALYGLDDELALSGDPGLHHEHIHPEDLSAVQAAEANALRSGILASTEFRVMLPNGSQRWMARRGKVQLEAGKAIFVSGLLIDVTAQKAAEKALRTSEKLLREADRRKDEFLATLAHELRNPLAPIRHAVKLLESRGVDERKHQWAREVISRQVQRMALLLDDLLDVSRITRGRLDLKIEAVDLESLVGAAVETARPLIESKHHQLSIELPPQPVALAVDPLRLSQSLSNLLTNAAKYTDPRGRITLTVKRHADEITMSVKDNGIGFDPEALHGMFEMFAQVDSAIDRAEGGLGIGLALVKGLIALHGGTVEGFSAGLGFGSEFIIHLPASALVPTSLEPDDAVSPSPSAHEARDLKVLVADDNRDAADSLAMVLEMNRYQVLVAHTGEQALRIARQTLPHAVILDIGMPDITGYDVAREIRSEPWGGEVLLLAITGWGQREDKERASAAGFDYHLTKPVDADQVEKLLRGFCDSRRIA